MSEQAAEISFDDFLKVDVRVGTIMRVEDFPEARRSAYQLWVDYGPEIGERKSSAQITKIYSRAELIGQQIIAVVNFPKKQIGPFMSEALVMGVPDENGEVVLMQPERQVPNGGRLY